jgi:uncharacterized protein YaiE (UPF0345 family)
MHMLDTEFESVNSYPLGSIPGSIGLSNASDFSVYLNPLQVPVSAGNQLISPKTIAFVDSSVSDALTLASNLEADIKVILDPTQDGISQITEVLSQYDGLTGIEIISHGNAAALQLGNSLLSQASLQQYSSALQQWSSSLTSNADILLYGCNIASDEFGQAFVDNLSALTGADVAASTNLTGNSAKGGDWTLEYTTGNIETAIPLGESLIGTYQGLLPSLFTTQTPTFADVTDGSGSAGDYELGMEFTSTTTGSINSIRYYKASSETGPHVGKIWSDTGTLLASVTFTNETTSGWQEQTLSSPLAIAANTKYVVSVNVNEYYVATPAGLATTLTNGDLSAIADGSNGVFSTTPDLFPTQSFNNGNYFRDIDFSATSVTSTLSLSGTPTQNQILTAAVANVPGLTTTGYQWQQSSDGTTWIDISGATNQTLTLGGSQVGKQVRALATFEDALNVEGLLIGSATSPIAPIVSSTQSIFTSQTPTLTNLTDGSGSAGDYEMGVEFTSAKAGTISSIRYYKDANETGPHVGKIWSDTGTLLASVNFTNETASGWQEQTLSTPLAIAANTKYVVSVNANTYYVATPAGLGTTVTNGDLSAVADGSNGVFNTTPDLFPAQSFNNGNYFRDIAFTSTSVTSSLSLSGTPTQNQTLTATVTNVPGLTTTGYQWQQSSDGTTWTSISGATSQTLTLGASQVGKQVRALATYKDALNVEGLLIGSATNLVNPIVNSTQNIFTTQTPTLTNLSDGVGSAGDYEMGVEFTSTKAGTISSIRYYKDANETGPHVGKIWSDTGTLLATVTFSNETASGWQEQALTTPLAIAANTKYVVSVNANTYYVATPAGLGTTVTNGDLSAIADGSNGVFNTTPDLFPTQSFNNGNYFRDIAFSATSVTSTISLSGTPTQNQTLTATVGSVPGLTTTGYQWQQSSDGTTWDNISGATNQTFTLGQSQVGKQVRALATYNDALNIKGLLIGSASSLIARDPLAPIPPATIFTTQTPSLTNLTDGSGSAGDYEMGVEFTSAKAGTINSIRYYKDANETGPHIGKVWSDTGTLLASVTFTNETASGWQEQTLNTPLAIAANTKYLVSVNTNTHYVATPGGLATTITNGDISAIADGSNGVFNTTPDLFPTQSFNNANYFRDIAFSATSVTSTISLSGTPTQNQILTATVGTVPGLTTTGYQWQQSSDGITWNNISGATNQTFTLGQSQVGKQVRALATYNDALNVKGLLIGSASSLIARDPLAPTPPTNIFTTQTPTLTNLTDGTGSAGDYELGMEFTSAKAGTISSIRYYKDANETGPHVGKIWSDAGVLLASVTFTNETASGWQEQTLSTPFGIAANTKYVVSVNANTYYVVTPSGLDTTITNGDLSAVADGSNGVLSTVPSTFPSQSFNNYNYFRDIAFTPTSITSTITVSGAAALYQTLNATVANVPGLTTTGYQWQQSSDGNTWTDIVGATGQTITLGAFQAEKQVRALATFNDTFNVKGVVISQATNPIATIVSPQTQSLFTSQTPKFTNLTDGVGSAGDYELGMEFTSTKAGAISSIRYYKDANETGPHIGKIWSNTGILLASVTFTNETASGWQEQTLSTPLVIAANTKYVVSVNANAYYVATPAGLATTITNGDISSISDGSNGVLNTDPSSFPNQSFNNTNYFRDIVYAPVISNPNNYLGAITFSGSPIQGQTLTATINDQDGLGGRTIKYQWQELVDGNWINIIGATNQTLTLGQSQVGRQVRATALYTDALGTSENITSNISSTVANINDDGLAILAGSATVGATLNANLFDADGLTQAKGFQTGIDYQWQQLINGIWTDIIGAKEFSLTLNSLLLDQIVRVTVKYLDDLGSNEDIFSQAINIAAQNVIVLENQKLGTTDWKISSLNQARTEIEGYADATSINKGETINFKVSLAQSGQYQIDVYRLGYYGGAGGRLITSISGLNGFTQANPIINPVTRLAEYPWDTSYTLQTDSNWTSGLYFAKLTDSKTGKQNYIQFTVRDDNRPADIGFQDAINTAAAYNNKGGFSTYDFNSNGARAYQVSFDRPFQYSLDAAEQFNNTLTWEYNMTRWLESQGYDISYYTNLDVSTNPLKLYSTKTFLSVGHDEYWTMEQRNNVEQARDNGINLAFFSANTAYWQVRYDPSSSGQSNRVMTIYKDNSGIGINPSIDPIAQTNPTVATTLFRSSQVNRPENSLLGVGYIGDIGSEGVYNGFDYVVSNASDPYYAYTGLQNGDILTGLVGYEYDGLLNNGLTPNGLVVLSQSPVPSSGLGTLGLLPLGTDDTISNAVRYTAASGAKVFSTGSIQWVWGLDSDGVTNPRVDSRVQQIAVNVFADMGAKPTTPSSGLIIS